MNKRGYSLVETIIALTLLSILVLAMLPVLSSTVLQQHRLEELRLQNQFLRNLITCVQRDVPIAADGETLVPTEGLDAGDSTAFTYRGVSYRVFGSPSDNGVFWYVIEREGMDEPIRLMRQE